MKALSKIVELKNINKFYKVGKEKAHILKSINLNIKKGEFVMIMGKSGSGKTTLLNILGFLDKFDEGEYIFNNQDVTRLNESERSNFRNLNIGFIFQQFNLINTLNIYQNVELPMIYNNKYSKQEKKEQIENNLSIVGLLDKIKQKPVQLSGGQQQRVAIARALVNDPEIIFADEPTGSLDSDTGIEIMELLKELNKQGKTIIMVTHDEDLTKYASKVIKLKDGLIMEEV
ncbi:MAG: ABC transporter ATP-binding protein [Peptostreptococcaceae bacterium]|jgi:putative ABC transport system ATP-binding protein|nr:ABC transporter ATP-binding protein [Peptostreptococcaceae bacterium]